MIIVYGAIILLALLFIFSKRKNLLFWSLGIYQISSYIIIISLIIYNIIFSVNNSTQSSLFERASYYIVVNLKIRVTDVVSVYNFGNFMLLISCVVFTLVETKKISFAKILLFVPPFIYLAVNHPRLKYLIWNYCMVKKLPDPLEKLVIINSVLLIVYFLFPIITLVVQYFKTRIFSKKIYILFTLLYVSIVELTMGLVLFANPYSNYWPLRYDINSLPRTAENYDNFLHPVFSANSKYIGLFLTIAILILAYVLIYCDFSITFNIGTRRSKKYESHENDEMLKTIFHTYKNAFFAIERFSYILDKSIGNDPTANEALANIKEISHSSYEQSRQMLDSVILSYDFKSKKTQLQLDTLLDGILLQFKAIPELRVEENFPDEPVYINGNAAALTEVFTNILNNAVEATENTEKPTIRVDLFTEDNSAVINFYDNGCGIEKNDMKKIFKPLYSSKQSKNNLGIGLSTTVKTINYHSGTVLCKSKPGEYTVFQIILPQNTK